MSKYKALKDVEVDGVAHVIGDEFELEASSPSVEHLLADGSLEVVE